MAVQPDTTSGNITLTSGSNVFTSTGVNLITRNHLPGDTIHRNGFTLIIASITGENAGTLTENCPAAAAGAAVPVRIRYQGDGSRVGAQTRALIELLSGQAFFQFDASGTLAERAAYDSVPKGFTFLNITTNPMGLYIKASNTVGDWAGPTAYATGPAGPAPTIGIGTVAQTIGDPSVSVGGTISNPLLNFILKTGVVGAPYTWSTTTTDADPGNGLIRANNASLASATQLFIDHQSSGGSATAAWLATFAGSSNPIKGHLILTTAANTQAIYQITGITVATGYTKVSVSGHSGETSFTNGAALSVLFLRAGDQGTATITDGDKGDITTSGSGTVWTLDAIVSAAKVVSTPTDELRITISNLAYPKWADKTGDTAAATANTAALVAATKKYVEFGEGSICVNKLPITVSGKKFIGYGRGVTNVIAVSDTLPAIEIAGFLSNIEIRDMTINRVGTPNGAGHGITHLGSVNLCKYQNLEVLNHYIGMNLGNTGFSWVMDSYIHANLSDGIRMMPPSGADNQLQWYLERLLLEGNVGRGLIALSNGYTVALGDWCDIYSFANSGPGIAVVGASGAAVNGVRLRGGFIGGDNIAEIYLDSWGFGHKIENLFIELCGSQPTGPKIGTVDATPASGVGNGITITANNEDVKIADCYISGNSNHGINTAATVMTTVLDSTIRAHEIGVVVADGSKYVEDNVKFVSNTQNRFFTLNGNSAEFDTGTATTTPTPTPATGALTSASGSFKYRRRGNVVEFSATITIASNGSGASSLSLALPLTAVGAQVISGVVVGTGKSVNGLISNNATSITGIKLYDGTYPGADGAVIRLAGQYFIS